MRILLLLILSICSLNSFAQNFVCYFPFASSNISEVSKEQIELLISRHQTTEEIFIDVKGYTDKEGSDVYNKRLSHDRAISIVALLKRSFPDAKFSVNSYGSNNLVSDKDEEQHLNRRVEISIVAQVKAQSVIQEESVLNLEPFLEDVEEQRFIIDLDDTVKVWAKEGTYIKIEPGSIQNYEGKLSTGKAELIIKEYYDPSKILLSGLNTLSDEGLLQTGGMASFTIMKGEQVMNNVTRKPVLLRMPQLREELIGMSVFNIQPEPNSDTSGMRELLWNNTNQPFQPIRSYWEKPFSPLFQDVYYQDDIMHTRMKVGATYESEYRPISYPIIMRFEKFFPRRNAKKVKYKQLKTNDSTIEMSVKIRYRGRGYRAFNRRTIDTTYNLKFIRPQYEGLSYSLNLINVDRLYRGGKRINQYVSTPGVSGLTVLAYFKSISAYLPASSSGEGSVLMKVPENVPVTLIAIGKNGEDFYFSKKEHITNAEGSCVMVVEKMPEKDFRKAMESL